MSDSEINLHEILENLSQNVKKISNALMLTFLMDYRESVEGKISQVILSDAKKAVWILCNGLNNNKTISGNLNKSQSTISEHIQSMVSDRIVFEITKGKEKYPISIDSLINSLIASSISL